LNPRVIFNEDKQELIQFSFKLGDKESTASLLDLPCVIESHKSLDSMNLFKSNNISQMLYVHPNNEKTLEEGKLFMKSIHLIRSSRF
jgi:transcription initiation factor TFIID subunit 7